jgi:uncharacterized protein (TIGR02118 family)
MIKNISLLTRKPGLTHEQFMKHWFEIHAPLALKVPGIRRYVQTHILDERKRADIASTDVEIDGIAELWYDSREAMLQSAATPEAKASRRERSREKRKESRRWKGRRTQGSAPAC